MTFWQVHIADRRLTGRLAQYETYLPHVQYIAALYKLYLRFNKAIDVFFFKN